MSNQFDDNKYTTNDDTRPKKARRIEAPQIKTIGRIKANQAGGECIRFNVNLEHFQLRCIVNVPGENEEEAPVYVQFHVRQPKDDVEVEHVVRQRRPPVNGSFVQGDIEDNDDRH